MLVDDELHLLLTNDQGYMRFQAASGLSISPQDITLDTQGLPYSWQPNEVAVTPYESDSSGTTGLPTHIQINFGVVDPADRRPTDPIMYIIPVDEYQELWGSNDDATISNTIDAIFGYTVAIPEPAPAAGVPVLPMEEVFGEQDLAVQLGRTGALEGAATVSGYRFVGRFSEGAELLPGEGPMLRYIYQGFTNDGRYLVNFFYPVTNTAFPNGEWEPSLETLDVLVTSLQIEGMPSVGLSGTAWMLSAASVEPGGVHVPVAAQEKYLVTFRADGSLEYVADCNRGNGNYAAAAGMLGRLSVTLGVSTLAQCEPGSFADILVATLSAAEEYLLHPGGQTLELPRADGGGSLYFALLGRAEVVPTPTPVPTVAVPTPAPGEPTGTVTSPSGVNVRLGPGTEYPIIGVAPFGATGQIVGRSFDGAWWATPIETSPTGLGWVSVTYIEAVNTDVFNVPVLPAPPLPPEPTPVPPTPAPVPQISFYAEPTVIDAGQCSTLFWRTGNVRAVWVYPVGANYQNFPVPGSGSRQECPSVSTTYELRAQLYDGSVELRQAQVNVNTAAAPIIEFSAEPTGIQQGQCTTLRWRVENVSAVWVYPQGADYRNYPVAGVDSRQECPPSTTTYEMRVQLRSGGTEFRTVTVDVSVSNPLAGTSWSLIAMSTGQTPVPGTAITLFFENNERLGGNAGCNQYSGVYTVSGRTLLIRGIGSSFQTCGAEIDQVEAAYLQALQTTASYHLDNATLMLFNASGNEILRFSR